MIGPPHRAYQVAGRLNARTSNHVRPSDPSVTSNASSPDRAAWAGSAGVADRDAPGRVPNPYP